MEHFNTIAFVHVLGLVASAIGFVCCLFTKDWGSSGWAFAGFIWCLSSYLWYKSYREEKNNTNK